MIEHQSTSRLLQLFQTLPEQPGPEQVATLRETVHEFVDGSKEKGAPIERVIIALKELAAEAGLRSSPAVLSYRVRPTSRDELLMLVVRWAVERYFGYERPPNSGEGFGEPRRRRDDGGRTMAPIPFPFPLGFGMQLQ